MNEQVRFEDGRVATKTWEDYPILRFSEIPEIEIELIDNPNEPTLGLGEGAVGPTGAAIGNAVARALGKRIRDLPLTRERIMDTLLERIKKSREETDEVFARVRRPLRCCLAAAARRPCPGPAGRQADPHHRRASRPAAAPT